MLPLNSCPLCQIKRMDIQFVWKKKRAISKKVSKCVCLQAWIDRLCHDACDCAVNHHNCQQFGGFTFRPHSTRVPHVRPTTSANWKSLWIIYDVIFRTKLMTFFNISDVIFVSSLSSFGQSWWHFLTSLTSSLCHLCHLSDIADDIFGHI